MWTPATRKNYSRRGLRYQSDVTDEEWRVIEPYLPPAKDTGRPRAWPLREIVNGIFYVMRSGCPWRQLPKDLPPWSTVYRWFAAWRDACVFEKINHALVMADRERGGREASPSAAIIDSQSVKTTEAGGPRGYDAGKKIKGRKRHAWLTPMDVASCSNRIPPAFRIAMAVVRFCEPRAACFPSSSGSLPMAGMLASVLLPPPASSSRLSPKVPIRSALPSYRVAGWLNGSSHGSVATGGLPRISRLPSTLPEPSSTPLPSCCSHAVSQGPHEFRN